MNKMMGYGLEKFVFSPVAIGLPSLAVAACRAGGVGVLDAELCHDIKKIESALQFLEAQSKSEYGLRLPSIENNDAWDGLLSRYVQRGLRYLIVSLDDITQWQKTIEFTHFSQGMVYVEVCEDDERLATLPSSISGIIVKGNESAGLVGEDSSFILLQKIVNKMSLPVLVRGGVSPHVAAACELVGVTGVVLDSQVLLLEESPIAEMLFPVIANLTGNETVAAGNPELGRYFRVLLRPGFKSTEQFIERMSTNEALNVDQELIEKVNYLNPINGVLPLGQDVCFAADWQQRFKNVAQVFVAIDMAIAEYVQLANKIRPMSEGGPLAKALSIDIPVVQGPMTRVSDNPEFAKAVAEQGALPMLALALLKGDPLKALLSSTQQLITDKSWGIGLLGFAPQDLFEEQLAIAKNYKPSYAIIAGGRPDQALRLEAEGIPSFLHVPSERLIPLFLNDGARRFIFEGRECGGHVGPLSSFVLWSSMIDRLLVELEGKPYCSDVQVLFAGGISDAVSSAMVQTLAAPLLKIGVKIGFVVGSAYLFTKEIVSAGAIVQGFQSEVLACKRTVNLESGPGHASRCAYTPFAKTFFETSRDLFEKNIPADERREKLDDMILGRLRIASKGSMRNNKGELIQLTADSQKDDGMYMLGQVATLHSRPLSIKQLHSQLGEQSIEIISQVSKLREALSQGIEEQEHAVDIAIVGIGSALPQSQGVEAYWENILAKVDAITEIPKHRWDWRLYFDENKDAKDKIYSKWGGFLDDMVFDPTEFGMPPKSISTVDPMQLMVLKVASQTLKDSGYSDKAFNREKASVIIGASGGAGDVGMQYGLRSELPRFKGDLPDEIANRLPEWSEDTFAGILMNVIPGRIANRFNFGGVNFATDAACASSLAAVYQGVSELVSGHSDFVIAGGTDAVQGPFGYLCFSKTQALSPRGRCRTFDASGDGIVISEGIALIALKRLSDAERDGDKIYAVIKGIGGSSDGKAKGLTAPLPEGQLRAMRRAYQQAGFSASTVGLFEAHGTGTVAGDTAELESTSSLLIESGAKPHQAVVGSVKTMIGHTKASAGVAGLIKAALALHHQTLPPHRNVEMPNKVLLEESVPLYLLDEAKPWLKTEYPRRAAVSAFGFGGTNFHAVMEEYRDEYRPWLKSAVAQNWTSELCVFSGVTQEALLEQIITVREIIQANEQLALKHVASSLIYSRDKQAKHLATVVASTSQDLNLKLGKLLGKLNGKSQSLPVGCYLGDIDKVQKLAILFSGQGSQYINMAREVSLYFPTVRETLERADSSLAAAFSGRFGEGKKLSEFIYPKACYLDKDKQRAKQALTSTDVAQPALGSIEVGLWRLLQGFNVQPDMFAGHSYGEFVALHAAGAIDFEALMEISESRGRFIVDEARAAGAELGTMAAVKATREQVQSAISGCDVIVANHNSPSQSIISGSLEGITAAIKACNELGLDAIQIPVAAAFHSSFVAPAKHKLAEVINTANWQSCQLPVYSNTTARQHVNDSKQLRATMVEHLVSPVEFVNQISAMYDDGARVFLEVGPKSVLTRQVAAILADKPHRVIAIDDNGGGLKGLLNTLAQLLCEGIDVEAEKLFAGRQVDAKNMIELKKIAQQHVVPKHAWFLNGSGARRVTDPQRQVGVTVESLAEQQDSITRSVNRNNASAIIPAVEPVSVAAVSTKHKNNNKIQIPGQKNSRQQYRKKEKKMSDLSSSGVMSDYFDTMRQFLETQERVMNNFIENSTGVDSGPEQRTARRMPRSLQRLPRSEQSVVIETPIADAIPAAQSASLQASQPVPIEPVVAAKSVNVEPVVEKAPENTASQNAADQPLTEAELTEKFLAVIEDRTGYPKDMVGLNQNLEADLGIDSIKRVEVVGAVLQELPKSLGEALGENRSALNTKSTLSEMIALLLELQNEGATAPFDYPEVRETVVEPNNCSSRDISLPSLRYCLTAKQQAIPANAKRQLQVGHFVIAGEGELASAVTKKLMLQGCTIHHLSNDVLSSEDSLLDWCQAFKNKPIQLTGLIHALPVSLPEIANNSPLTEFSEQVFKAEKSLFILLQQLAKHLIDSAHVITLSHLNEFSRGEASSTGLSIQGGHVGVVKSLLEEKPKLRVKAVDIDNGLAVETMASLLIDEIEVVGGRIEVAYPKGERTIYETVAESVDKSLSSIDYSQAVILATGGGRGVTAEVLRGLAVDKPTLILTGRSALEKEEPEQTRNFITEKSLQDYFIEQVRNRQLTMKPAEIKQAIEKIIAARELRNNISDFETLGAKVEYHAIDVNDEPVMKAFINGLYNQYGRIDGVIHGAGIIDDAKLENKSLESWSRVVNTKVNGLFLLQKYLYAKSLKFFSVFSSVAGRYGNTGQLDYACANELMNRLCCQLNKQWGFKVNVTAFNWGPWGKTTHGAGMVNAETEAKFAEKGVHLVSAKLGETLFNDEIRYGLENSVEIVVGQSHWEQHESRLGKFVVDDTLTCESSSYPLLTQLSIEKTPKGETLIDVLINEQHAYLLDHKIDDIPVLPAAAALEMMSEAVASVWPEWTVVEVRDLRLLKGVLLNALNKPLTIQLNPPPYGSSEGFEINVVIFSEQKAGKTFHYKSIIRLANHFEEGQIQTPKNYTNKQLSVRQAYDDYLFHGPSFQVIADIHGFSDEGGTANFTHSMPSQWLTNAQQGDQPWLFDPAVVDAALQMTLLWVRLERDLTALPGRIGRITRYVDQLPEIFHAELIAEPTDDPTQVHTHAYFSDENHQLLLVIEDIECVANSTLNRLAGTARRVASL